ncbi:hypothetical protein M406DRAFT_357263 [Cryphonectria parasitica EP155]|uniref:Uncharacterized protein n=1 Tax=Cryphonectria parasitica (strain ATCC 38755 / EP155) TaxID=660469 RepID=A0A9P4XZP8_CRYP1|nr:uncharacterized protein M406DRAFT_357263 [Cryphonectria parasitica EP155]KAF3763871.1 hypothetical protein M406DRAFT_357263 [Cryphonectria parasitica EP155]
MPPQLKIHVQGSGSVFRTAERGVLYIEIACTGTDKVSVSSTVTSTTERLVTTFRQYALKTEDGLYPHPGAGITTFAVSAPTTHSYVPMEWVGDEHRPAARQYTVITNAEVVFRDLSLLARLASDMTAMPNVGIDRTEWRLTDATRKLITREARVKAMENAVEKARDYASVVGRNMVAVSIDDGPSNVTFASPFRSGGFGGVRMAPMQQQRQMQPQQMQTQPRQMQMQLQQMQQRLAQAQAAQAQAAQAQAAQAQAAQAQAAQAQAAQTQAAGTSVEGPSLEPSTITVDAQVDVKFVSTDGEEVDMSLGDD